MTSNLCRTGSTHCLAPSTLERRLCILGNNERLSKCLRSSIIHRIDIATKLLYISRRNGLNSKACNLTLRAIGILSIRHNGLLSIPLSHKEVIGNSEVNALPVAAEARNDILVRKSHNIVVGIRRDRAKECRSILCTGVLNSHDRTTLCQTCIAKD